MMRRNDVLFFICPNCNGSFTLIPECEEAKEQKPLCFTCRLNPNWYQEWGWKIYDVTLPKKPKPVIKPVAWDDENVTPKHVKPLVIGMKSANICVVCGNAFETARKHSKTCSPKCRKALSRRETKNG